MEGWHVVAVFSVFVLLTGSTVLCSPGDRNQVYRECLSKCGEKRGGPTVWDKVTTTDYFLQFWRWTTMDECKYECMWNFTEDRVATGKTVHQFHGKWPFVRFLGMQEPASCFFSLLNGISHAIGLSRLIFFVPSESLFRSTWLALGVVNVNGWLWSFIFHARDLDWTEKLDYYCALSITLMYLVAALVKMSNATTISRIAPIYVGAIAFMAYHINLMNAHFDYGYNMLVNVIVSASAGVIWTVWCLLQICPPKRKVHSGNSHIKYCAISVCLIGLSSCLELLDFPPILWTFDAHSLWHALTFPVALLWYQFVISDCFYTAKVSLLPKKVD